MKKAIFLAVFFLIFSLECWGQEKKPAVGIKTENKPAVSPSLTENIEASLKNALAENLKVTAENENLKKQLGELQNYVRALGYLNDNLRGENAALSAKAGDAESVKKKIAELENNLDLLGKENIQMQEKAKVYSRSLKELSKDNASMKQKLQANFLERENRQNKIKLIQLQARADRAAAEISKVVNEKEVLSRECAVLCYNLGYMLFKAHEYKKAAEEFKRSLELNPLNADACYNLGVIYDEYLEDDATAILYYQKYLELVPAGAGNLKSKVEAKLLQSKFRRKNKIDSPVDQTIR